MAQTFQDLGLRTELADAAAAAGYGAPAPLQRAAIPVLRRGGNAVLHGSPGSGVVAAWGLALLDRLAGGAAPGADADGAGAAGPAEAEAREPDRDGEPPAASPGEPADPPPARAARPGPPAALVLVADSEAAVRTAESLARFADAVGLRATALEPEWPAAAAADVLVATPVAALREVRSARLKLEGVVALVLDGASNVMAVVAEDVLDTLASTIGSDAQRVVVTDERTEAVERFVERQARRALHIPARPAAPGRPAVGPAAAEPGAGPALEYVVVREADKAGALSAWLAREDTPAAIVACRTPDRAERLARVLRLRGYHVEAADREGRIRIGDGEPGASVSYDVPFDAESLRERHAGGGLVLLTARELPHLRRIAGEADTPLRAMEAGGGEAADDLATFRDRLAAAVAGEDLAAQILVLQPLFERFSAAEVAAAASALLRRRMPEPKAAPPPRRAAAAVTPPPRTWARLFVSSGQRDGLRPGDLVGAITGEAGIAGDQIGKIEIRDTFSIAEVASEVAPRVIQAMNGITLKGRSLRVDYDRRPTGGGARRGGGR